MPKRRGFKWDAANARLSVEVDGTQVAKFDATIPTAYTQTYDTADKTHAADGSSDVATANLADDGGAYNAAWCDTVVTMCNEIKADFNNLRATVTDLKNLVNSVIDDLQDLGLVG